MIDFSSLPVIVFEAMKAAGSGGYFSSRTGRFIKRVALLSLAVWTGSLIGNLSILAAAIAGRLTILPYYFTENFLWPPGCVVRPLTILNVLFVGIAACWFIFSSASIGLRIWLSLIAVEGFVATDGAMHWLARDGWRSAGSMGISIAAWGTWLLLTAMAGSGFWVYHGWRMNRWNAEILAIEAKTGSSTRERNREMIAKALAEESPNGE